MKNQYGILTKSNRAIAAEQAGLKKYSELESWQKRAVDKGVVKPCEWHHTGAAANKTYYYNLDEFADLKAKDFPPNKIVKEEQADLKRIKLVITYDEMVGGFTTKRKKYEEKTVEGLDIRKKDNVIMGASGRKLSSNNKIVKILYKGYRCKKWKEISKVQALELGYKFTI